jgi:hypothetical protein
MTLRITAADRLGVSVRAADPSLDCFSIVLSVERGFSDMADDPHYQHTVPALDIDLRRSEVSLYLLAEQFARVAKTIEEKLPWDVRKRYATLLASHGQVYIHEDLKRKYDETLSALEKKAAQYQAKVVAALLAGCVIGAISRSLF